MKQLFIGLTTEGTTDVRFLESIVTRTFEDIVFCECEQEIEIYAQVLKVDKHDLSFPEYVTKAAMEGFEQYGIMTLAIHTDADKETYQQRYNDKIIPAYEMLNQVPEDNICKILTPIIPVRMIEAWMLADTSLFIEELATDKSKSELHIDKNPETMADPKQVIEDAIRIATEHLPKRRQRLTIADMYAAIGSKIELSSLRKLSSFRLFEDAIRDSLRKLHYLV